MLASGDRGSDGLCYHAEHRALQRRCPLLLWHQFYSGPLDQALLQAAAFAVPGWDQQILVEENEAPSS